MSELIDKLGINPYLFLAQVVNFLLLLFILTKFLYRPIIAMLDKRSEKIAKSLQQVEKIEQDARRAQEAFDIKIKQAHNESTKVLTEARHESERIRTETIGKAEQEASLILERGKQALHDERDVLMRDIRSEVSQLVVQLTSKILSEELTKDKQKEIEIRAAKELTK